MRCSPEDIVMAPLFLAKLEQFTLKQVSMFTTFFAYMYASIVFKFSKY
jgi:hypothetical protein